MTALQFHCPLCTGLFQVDDSLAGVALNCPHCAGVVTVPSPGPPASDVDLPPSYPRGMAAPPAAGDPLLPPPADASSPPPPAREGPRLPPTAAVDTGAERVPLPPAIPSRTPQDAVMIPTEHGYVGVYAPIRTVVHRGEEIELRQLSAGEKARRRMVRNALLFATCLLALILVLAWFLR